MASNIWILFAFRVVAYIKAFPDSNRPCKTAISELLEIRASQHRDHTDLMTELNGILNPGSACLTPNASVEAIVDHAAAHISAICPQFNVTAQAVENVVARCSYNDRCQNYSWKDFTPDVYRAMAKYCEGTQGRKLIQHVQTLVPCFHSLSQRWSLSSEADDDVARRVSLLLAREWGVFEKLTVSCGSLCGRKCACRRVQVVMPFYTRGPNANIREACGQRAQDLVLELQERVLDALDCSEFGSYGQEWGWLKVTYLAIRQRQLAFNDLTLDGYAH